MSYNAKERDDREERKGSGSDSTSSDGFVSYRIEETRTTRRTLTIGRKAIMEFLSSRGHRVPGHAIVTVPGGEPDGEPVRMDETWEGPDLIIVSWTEVH